jgi:hypothetical protein
MSRMAGASQDEAVMAHGIAGQVLFILSLFRLCGHRRHRARRSPKARPPGLTGDKSCALTAD